MVEEVSPLPRPGPRTPSIHAPTRIWPSDPVGTEEEDPTASWAILDSFPAMQMPAVDETILDEHAKKWLADKKKEINDRREYEVARATAAADHAARMREEEAARMQAEQYEQDAFRLE